MENVLRDLTSFVGRERELGQIAGLLASARLLTLVGPGGCGKTRLAQRAAAQITSSSSIAACWVDLAPLSAAELIPQAIADAVGVHETGSTGLLPLLESFLRAKQLLMVLDNCEHLIAACAELCEHLLRAAPALRILATSRESLTIPGEVIFRVAGLALPDDQQSAEDNLASLAQCESIQLFVERARAVRPQFTLSMTNAPAVVRLCRRLDGIPLALELAAARVQVLPIEQIVSRLDHALGLLTAGSRTAPPRHRTLRAAIDWSVATLNEAERELLARLAVFPGGCSLEAVEHICAFGEIHPAQVIDLLAALIDKSLVAVHHNQGEARYRLLEIVRQYALERLSKSSDSPTLRQRYCQWYLTLAERAGGQLHGRDQARWLALLQQELANLRLAFEWSQRDRAPASLQLVSALWFFWILRSSLSEGRRWFAAALTADNGPMPPSGKLRAQALWRAGAVAWVQGDATAALPLLQESIALWQRLDEQHELAYAEMFLGLSLLALGDPSAAARLARQSIERLRGTGDGWGLALANASLGQIQVVRGELGAARGSFQESRAMWSSVGDRWGLALAMHQLGWLGYHEGDRASAEALFTESNQIFRELGETWHIAAAQVFLADMALTATDYRGAVRLLRDSLKLYEELGRHKDRAWCLAKLTVAALGLDQQEIAVRLAAAGLAGLEATGARLSPADELWLDRRAVAKRSTLTAERVTALWNEGLGLTPQQIDALAAQLDVSPRPAQTVPSPTMLDAAYSSGLTARELEVLRLVASGLTDRQIAEQLILSPRTVNSHLRSIYNKLGVSTRSAATRFAFEHRLV